MSNTLTLSEISAVVEEQGSVILPLRAESLCEYAPLGFDAGDDNLYRFVGNDPTDETDPTGLFELPPPGGYDRLPPSSTLSPAQMALQDIQNLYNGYVGAVYNNLLQMIQSYPTTGSGPNRQRLDPNNLPQDLKDEAAAIAKLYVDAVINFLKTHPDARPMYGTTWWKRTDKSPDCDNWATAVNTAVTTRQWKYFNIRWVTHRSGYGYQHQYVLVTPMPYKVVPGAIDSIPVILDPWPTITPLTYTIQDNWTGHRPDDIF